MTKRIWPIVAMGMIAVMTAASANTSLFDNIIDNGTLTTSGNVRFSAYTTGVALFSGSGIMSSVAPSTSGNLLTSNGTTWTSAAAPASGVTTMGAFGSSPNGNAATIAGTTLTLQPADATNPGGVSTAAQAFGGVKTFTNPVVGTQSPLDNSTKAASTAYVDAAVTNDGPAKDACNFSTTAALPSIVYANGASGVGATLTGVALAAISVDGSSPTVGQRILVHNQASTFQNGIYSVTQTGSGIAVFILTRTSDNDQSGEFQAGSSTFILSGTVNASTTWDQNSASSPTVGTDPITFVQTAGPGSTTIGAFSSTPTAPGLTFTGSVLNMDPADLTHPGGISLLAQTMGAGVKTFQVAPIVTTFTSGPVLFGGLNGVLAQDTSNLFWDQTNKRVGIGTVTPTVPLEIKSNGATAELDLTQVNGNGPTKFMTGVSGYLTIQNSSKNILTTDATGSIGLATFAANGPANLDSVGVANQAGLTTKNTFAIQGIASQTGKLLNLYSTGSTSVGGIDVAGAGTLNGGLTVGVIGSTSGKVVFNGATSSSVSVVPAAAAGNWTLTLPPNTGTNGQFLKTDGAGTATWAAASSSGAATAVLTKTSGYVVVTGDFDTVGFRLLLEANCSSACTMTLPAASNSGYDIKIINIGTAVVTVSTAGSDTFGSTADTTWYLNPLGDPQSSNNFIANGGTRWNGF